MKLKMYESLIGCIAIICILTVVNKLIPVEEDIKESSKLRVNYNRKQVQENINGENGDEERVRTTNFNKSSIEVLPNPDLNEVITLELL